MQVICGLFVDQSLKMLLNANDSSESKLDALCKKYTEFAEEHKQLKNKYKLLEKQLTLVCIPAFVS